MGWRVLESKSLAAFQSWLRPFIASLVVEAAARALDSRVKLQPHLWMMPLSLSSVARSDLQSGARGMDRASTRFLCIEYVKTSSKIPGITHPNLTCARWLNVY